MEDLKKALRDAVFSCPHVKGVKKYIMKYPQDYIDFCKRNNTWKVAISLGIHNHASLNPKVLLTKSETQEEASNSKSKSKREPPSTSARDEVRQQTDREQVEDLDIDRLIDETLAELKDTPDDGSPFFLGQQHRFIGYIHADSEPVWDESLLQNLLNCNARSMNDFWQNYQD